METPNKHHW
jgi:hypothetical protein